MLLVRTPTTQTKSGKRLYEMLRQRKEPKVTVSVTKVVSSDPVPDVFYSAPVTYASKPQRLELGPSKFLVREYDSRKEQQKAATARAILNELLRREWGWLWVGGSTKLSSLTLVSLSPVAALEEPVDELHKLLKFQAAGLVNLTGASILAVGAARLARVLKIDITTHTLRMPGDCLCRRQCGG